MDCCFTIALENSASGINCSRAWVVGNVDHCVKELSAFIAEYGITDLVTWAAPPGLRPDYLNGSLERYFRDVVPRLKALAG